MESYSLHYVDPSSLDNFLLKIWSSEGASWIHFTLKDGLGPACLGVSKEPAEGSKATQTEDKGKNTFI